MHLYLHSKTCIYSKKNYFLATFFLFIIIHGSIIYFLQFFEDNYKYFSGGNFWLIFAVFKTFERHLRLLSCLGREGWQDSRNNRFLRLNINNIKNIIKKYIKYKNII